MSVHSRVRDIKELGTIGGKKPISRQPSSSSRSSSVVIMESLAKTLTELMQQQQEQMQQHLEFMKGLRKPSLDLNPVELRTNPSDGNFAFHAVPPQVTAPLATRPSITSEVRDVISPFGRPSRAVEGPQLPRSDGHLSVPRKTRLTSDSVTFSPLARSREPGYEPKFPTKIDTDPDDLPRKNSPASCCYIG